MSGQSAPKTVKEVKAAIKAIETNTQMNHGSGGTECGSNAKPGSRPIGKK